MTIEKMNETHFDEILEVDKLAFKRDVSREIENLRMIQSLDVDGNFVSMNAGKIEGYVFSRTLGTEGYIGPIGVHPDCQNAGIGKMLIEKSLLYLKVRCNVIGLETLPEIGKNVGFYYKLGFESTFPSILFKIPEDYAPPVAHGTFTTIKSEDSLIKIIDSIESANKRLKGISFAKELHKIIAAGGSLAVALSNSQVLGFLAYSQKIVPFIWGHISQNKRRIEILRGLITRIAADIDAESRMILVNAGYKSFVKTLTGEGFEVIRSRNRMLLSGYEGDYFTTSQEFLARAWMG